MSVKRNVTALYIITWAEVLLFGGPPPSPFTILLGCLRWLGVRVRPEGTGAINRRKSVLSCTRFVYFKKATLTGPRSLVRLACRLYTITMY